jgi:hypothetical protein
MLSEGCLGVTKEWSFGRTDIRWPWTKQIRKFVIILHTLGRCSNVTPCFSLIHDSLGFTIKEFLTYRSYNTCGPRDVVRFEFIKGGEDNLP